MSLDLSKVAGQVTGMVAQLKEGNAGRLERLDFALKAMSNVDFDKLSRKVANSRTTWLVAGLVESLAKTSPALLRPADFTVLATDGSQIDVDRHQAARCFLINIGSVLLKYGTSPDARLESFPRLYSGDKDMVIAQQVRGTANRLSKGLCSASNEASTNVPAWRKWARDCPRIVRYWHCSTGRLSCGGWPAATTPIS